MRSRKKISLLQLVENEEFGDDLYLLLNLFSKFTLENHKNLF